VICTEIAGEPTFAESSVPVDTRRQPALRLLIDRSPGRQVVRHPAPRRARLHDVAQAIEHLAQAVLALPRILALKRQIRHNQRPFFIGYVRRIRLADKLHPSL